MSQYKLQTIIVTHQDMEKMFERIRDILRYRKDMYPPEEWDIREEAEEEALREIENFLCE